METFNFTHKDDLALTAGSFIFYWTDRDKSYSVTHPSHLGIICKVYPYAGEAHHQLSDPRKMYTVKADKYPGIGNLEQMVKGSDLMEYVESILMGRSQ
jgi:hypothetical protein